MKKDWTYKKFEDCIENVKYTTKIQSKDYMASGEYPIISQEEELVSGYWNKNEDVFSAPRPLVVFGDHTRVLKYIDFDFVLGADGVKILLPIEDLEAKFLYYFLKWYNVPNLGYSRHYKLLKEISIPIPPLSIQQSIVAELDLLHSMIEKKKEQLNELDNLAQSLFYQMFGDPITNPMGWEVKKLGDACLLVTDGSHYSPKADEKGTYPMLSVKDMKQDSFDYSFAKMVGENEYRKLVQQGCRPNVGDVLVAKDGSYFRYIFCVKEEKEQALLSSIAILRPSNVLDSEYLRYFLSTKYIFDLVEQNYLSGSALKRVILKGIKQIPISLPPLSLQQSFAAKVSAIEAQKQAVQQSIREVEALLAERMDNYFS